MSRQASLALSGYLPAFENPEEPFLHHYSFPEEGAVAETQLTRGEFWTLSRKAAAALTEQGRGKGDCFALCFGANHYLDLAFRLAAAMTGTIPVTINWQADPVARIAHKIRLTECRLILTDRWFSREKLGELQRTFPQLPVFCIEDVRELPPLPEDEFCRDPDLNEEFTKIIIFTSGTTGEPKGVRLPYRCYRTNRATFESFLAVSPDCRFATVVVNPLHHTNSTAVTDWALRRPGTHLHLMERYSTPYWRILVQAVTKGYERMAAPLVSRHFDFLESLIESGRLPVELTALKDALGKVDVLIGSAPVGPTTVKRFLRLSARTPRVRFGSTETCLQVLGIPHHLCEEAKQKAFERGWSHEYGGERKAGYYIGRPHPPYTEARIVKSTTPGDPGYMQDCEPGEPGFLLTRGDNLMSGYVKDPEATADVFRDGWYNGLGDVCFALRSPQDSELDYYWMSRTSSLLLRGGANYSGAQIAAELKDFIVARYRLPADAFEVAVIGLKIGSEHEDSCCVAIELLSEGAEDKRRAIEGAFLQEAPKHVSKGARPDLLRFMPIPRNFKGAIQVEVLKDAYRESLESGSEL